MDLSQLLGILNMLGGVSQGGANSESMEAESTNASNANSSKDNKCNNSSNNNSSNNNLGANSQFLNLLIPLLLSGNTNQDAVFEMLAKTNPLLAQVMSVIPKKKQEARAFRKKNTTTYVKVADYYSNHK